MNAFIELTTPSCAPADFGFAAVALDHKEVTGLQLVALEFAVEQFELLDLRKVQTAALDVGHAEVGE